MERLGIGILCLQETHRSASIYYDTDDGYLLILSGDGGESENAGVGFLISPGMRRSIIGFCQASSRMATLKLRIRGGKTSIFSVYAPHNGKPIDERRGFYNGLGELLGSTSAHGLVLLYGDFNARLYRRFPTEEDIIGDHIFGNTSRAEFNHDSNRSLLVEMCMSHKLVIGNTLFDEPPERQITCYNVGANPGDEILPNRFGQIVFVLISKEWVHLYWKFIVTGRTGYQHIIFYSVQRCT